MNKNEAETPLNTKENEMNETEAPKIAARQLDERVDRRERTVARWPNRRKHPFRSPWPLARMTKCEDCGVYAQDHPLLDWDRA